MYLRVEWIIIDLQSKLWKRKEKEGEEAANPERH